MLHAQAKSQLCKKGVHFSKKLYTCILKRIYNLKVKPKLVLKSNSDIKVFNLGITSNLILGQFVLGCWKSTQHFGKKSA